MKTMGKSLNAWVSAICASLLGFLGFGCSEDDPGGGGLLMYGCPYSTFEIKGKVVNEEGNGVTDAEIRIADEGAPSGVWCYSVTSVGKSGKYDTKGNNSNDKKLKVVCIPKDEGLEADSVVVEMKYKGKDKKDPWYQGHATATVDFTLKEKSGE